MIVNEPFNRHASNDGKIKLAGAALSGQDPVAIFADTAGNEVARLSGKQINKWLEGKRPESVSADIPREILSQGLYRLHDFEERMFRTDVPSP